MTELSNKVLDELREQDLRPVPAWRFVLQSVLAWIGFTVLMVLGAQTVSIILFLLSDHDWSELSYFRGGRLGYLLMAVPYLWLLALVLLLIAAYLDFKRTKGGYRYRPLLVIGVVVVVSLLAGVGLHAVGLGQRADALLEKKVEFYRQVTPRGMHLWNHPEQGLLIGQVEQVNEDGSFELRAPQGGTWLVRPGQVQPLSDQPVIQPGSQLRLKGRPAPNQEFEAQHVLPWRQGMKQRIKLNFQQNQRVREEMLQRARSTGERSMRPLVHPVAPTEQ